MSDCGDVKKVFVKPSEEPIQEVIEGIEISDEAANKIKSFVQTEGKDPQEAGLYVIVKKDGCSGKSYEMTIESIKAQKENGAKCFEKDGSTLMIDKLSYLFLVGSRLDYKEALTGSGFSLNNPNIKKSCACGSSFAV